MKNRDCTCADGKGCECDTDNKNVTSFSEYFKKYKAQALENVKNEPPPEGSIEALANDYQFEFDGGQTYTPQEHERAMLADFGYWLLDEIESRKPVNPNYRYGEDQIFEIFLNYVNSTYGQHYVGNSKKIQTAEYIYDCLGSTDFFRANIIKYASRLNKKKDAPEKDILKIFHYTMLLYFFEIMKNQNNSVENVE